MKLCVSVSIAQPSLEDIISFGDDCGGR